jgi:hypothetical protein
VDITHFLGYVWSTWRFGEWIRFYHHVQWLRQAPCILPNWTGCFSYPKPDDVNIIHSKYSPDLGPFPTSCLYIVVFRQEIMWYAMPHILRVHICPYAFSFPVVTFKLHGPNIILRLRWNVRFSELNFVLKMERDAYRKLVPPGRCSRSTRHMASRPKRVWAH